MAAGKGLGERFTGRAELSRVPDGTTKGPEYLLLVAAAIMLVSSLQKSAGGLSNGVLLAVAVLAALPAAREMLRWARLARLSPVYFCVEEEGIHIRTGDNGSLLFIPYDQVLSMEEYKWPRRSLMLCIAGRMPLDLRAKNFGSPADIPALEAAVGGRIRLLPDGSDRLKAILERQRAGAAVLRTLPWMSLGVAAALAGLFALQNLVDATTNLERLLALGASKGELVLQGEIVRLASPSLLHLDVAHLGINVGLLVMLGAMFEGFLGRARFVVLIGVASIVGVAFSSLVDPASSTVGASPGVMGLLGALLIMNATRRDEIPSRLRLPWSVVVALVGFAVATELSQENLDHAMHIAGVAAGAVIYHIMVWRRPLATVPGHTPPVLYGLACAIASVYVLACIHVVRAAWSLGAGTS